MDFPTAVRLGRKSVDRQAFDTFFDFFSGEKEACVLGMAALGAGFEFPTETQRKRGDFELGIRKFLRSTFPILENNVLCPACQDEEDSDQLCSSLEDVAEHLNDVHEWKWHRIVTWIERKVI